TFVHRPPPTSALFPYTTLFRSKDIPPNLTMAGEPRKRPSPNLVSFVPDTTINKAQAIGHAAIYPGNISETLKIIPVNIRPIKPNHPIIVARVLLILILDKFTQS